MTLRYLRTVLMVGVTAFGLNACSGCSGGGSNSFNASDNDAAAGTGAREERVRFIAIGDTGTGNSGNPEHLQYQVADMMRQVCEVRGCDFALMAGDNMFEQGVTSVNDPLFDEAFEQPYAALDIPFYLSLGNHDNSQTDDGEGSMNLRGDFQVAYTDVSPSGNWRMPFRYFSQRFPEDSDQPILELITLDSSPITHITDDTDPNWSGAALNTYIQDQMAFVQDSLATSPARWKIALAHHPYVSNGPQGNAGTYAVGTNPDPCSAGSSNSCRGEQYKTFLEDTICGEVDFFVSGHDNELYWLEPQSSCGKTHFMVSGAGAKRSEVFEATRNPVYFQTGQTWGFFWIELRQDSMIGAAYGMHADGTPLNADDDGNPLPIFELILPRVD